jgi:hypothetical protein
MELNGDFSRRVALHAADLVWQVSPMPGVQRKMLDRIGDEVARATTLVRYAPGSRFSAHTHDGGEEFLVLDGVFQDEYGDYPAGSYVRNPPTSSHTPASQAGCTIFVKLRQFDADDRVSVRIDTSRLKLEDVPERPGVTAAPLFGDDREAVRLERWAAGAHIVLDAPAGIEILVIDGRFTESGETFMRHSWLRLPAGCVAEASAGDGGCSLWVKAGHSDNRPMGRI